MKSKVSIPDTVRAWGAMRFSPFYRRKLWKFAASLDNGVPLREALVQYARLFPPDVVRLVQLGADSKHTILLLNESLEDADRLSTLHALTMSRFIYLFMLGVEFFFLGLFIVHMIVPRMEEIFADFGIGLRTVMPAVVLLESGILNYLPWLCSVAVLVLFVFMLLKLEIFHFRPWFTRRLFHDGDSAKMLRTLSAGVQRGVPCSKILDAYQLPLTSRYLVRQSRAIGKAIDSGTNWIIALRRYHVITAQEATLLETSEQIGNTAFILNELALTKEAKQLRFDDLGGKLAFTTGIIFLGILLAVIAVCALNPMNSLIISLT